MPNTIDEPSCVPSGPIAYMLLPMKQTLDLMVIVEEIL